MTKTSQESGALDEAFAREWIRAYTEAFHQRDANATAAMCTEDVVHGNPVLAAPEHGRDSLRAFAEDMMRAFPDLRIVNREPCFALNEPRLLLPYRLSGTMSGPLDSMRMAPTGRSVGVDAVDEYVFRGELACGIYTYLDAFDMGRQLGSLPARGSLPERLMAPMQRLQAVYLRRRSAL